MLATSCLAEQSPAKIVKSKIFVGKSVLDNANKYLYVREKTNNNDAPEIDKFLKYHGLGPGFSWCQAFANYNYYEAFLYHNEKTPFPKIARCSTFARWCLNQPVRIKVITAKQVLAGAAEPHPGDIANFKHGPYVTKETFTYNGHAAIVISYNKITKTVTTIEGNTKPSNQGDQTGVTKGDLSYGHDGVYVRERSIGLKTKFPILYFIRPIQQEFIK